MGNQFASNVEVKNDWKDLRDQLHDVKYFSQYSKGEFICPWDEKYEKSVLIWNRAIRKKPAVIAYCEGVADILNALSYAKKHTLQVSVRGGGHSVADGGLVVDLSRMNSVRVDVQKKIAFVEGGALWYDVDRETHIFKLATPGGLISHTGVGGLTLGGGIGWMSRSFGLSCDNLIGVDMVLANGEFIQASEENNSDLFFAIRGGGGNFGIVTGFQFKLHPLDKVVFSDILFKISKAKEVLLFYDKFAQSCPNNLTSFLFITQQDISIMSVYNGTEVEALSLLKPLYGFEPFMDQLKTISYPDLQTMFDRGNSPGNYAWARSSFLSEISEKFIDELLQHIQVMPPSTNIEFMHLGGAIQDTPKDATAFYFREAAYELHAITNWKEEKSDEETQEIRNWGRKLHDIAMSHSTLKGGYLNINTEGLDSSQLYQSNYQRLREIKTKYDSGTFT